MARLLLKFLILLVVAAAATAAVVLAWTAIGGGPLPIHGLIALSLGLFGTAALAWLLMALAFRSDREGWDERADRTGGADLEDRDKP